MKVLNLLVIITTNCNENHHWTINRFQKGKFSFILNRQDNMHHADWLRNQVLCFRINKPIMLNSIFKYPLNGLFRKIIWLITFPERISPLLKAINPLSLI